MKKHAVTLKIDVPLKYWYLSARWQDIRFQTIFTYCCEKSKILYCHGSVSYFVCFMHPATFKMPKMLIVHLINYYICFLAAVTCCKGVCMEQTWEDWRGSTFIGTGGTWNEPCEIRIWMCCCISKGNQSTFHTRKVSILLSFMLCVIPVSVSLSMLQFSVYPSIHPVIHLRMSTLQTIIGLFVWEMWLQMDSGITQFFGAWGL